MTRNIASSLRAGSRSRIEIVYELQQGLIDAPESPSSDEELARYLKQKYPGKKFDLILSMVAPRVRTILEKDHSLFQNVPKIFYEFDSERDATNRSLGPNITGVWADLNPSKTLDFALALNPGARKVVVISGVGAEDDLKRERAQVEFRKYESRAEFSWFTGHTIEELRSELAALNKSSVVIFLLLTRDRAGNRYSGPEAISLIAPASNAPIYGSSDTLMGLGITGGNLLDFEGTGKRIGAMSLRILAGEQPEHILQETAPTAMTVDWRELQRWGISEKNLPLGTIIRFRQPSFWELYKWYAIALIAAVIIEAMLIAWLLLLRIRRRQAEAENLRLARVAEADHRRLGEIVSNVPGIVWESQIDPETKQRKTTFISDHLRKMLGYTPEEWLAAPAGFGLEIMSEEDREKSKSASEAVIASGKEGSTQFRWQTKDGRTVWAENYLSPIFDGDEKIVGLRGVTLDITERKRGEESLRQTEEKDRAILSAIPDLMFLQTRDGVYLDYHAKDSEDLPVPPGELLGKNMRDVLPAGLAEDFFSCFERANGNRDPQLLEYQLTINNIERWFEARFVASGENILSVVRDITDRKQALDELRQSEERFGKAFRANPQPMSLTTLAEGRYLDVNVSFLTMSGYTREEVIGHTSLELNIWDMPESRNEFVRQLREHGSVINAETKLRTSQGDLRVLLSSGERLEIGGEQCLLIASSDITERILAEQALQNAHAEVSRLKNQLQEENIYLQEQIRLEQHFGEIIGGSDALKYVLFKIEQVAPTDSTVLITGETGTGKELVARAIHNASSRRDRPMVKVNCGALSASLIESELFGHEKGSFTGAAARKIGRFELAHGATLFLDEIGELPTDLQVKLLRVIQEGEFERLGSSKTIKADVRIIAATNRNLDQDVRKGLFREDLWYRLNVFPITVPPLRERREDVPLLVEHFVGMFAKKLRKVITSITPATLKSLSQYSWPGNVRELANVIERAVINSHGSVLRIGDDFDQAGLEKLNRENKTLEELERDYIGRILAETNGRIEGRHGAARILGINPSTLRARIIKLGVTKPKDSDNSSAGRNYV